MSTMLTRLHPPDASRRPLKGLCLKHRLVERVEAGRPFIYSSFIMSLNGAIAIGEGDGSWSHPATLTDPRDLRLLCELMAQADCLVTSAGYLRDLGRGRLGNLLQLPQTGEYQDLFDYRARHHASPFPSVLVVSRSLDFELPSSIAEHRQTLRVLAPKGAPARRVTELQEQGVEVIVGDDEDWVGSELVVGSLKELGARTAYLFCGPRLNATLMRTGQLGRLYLTWLHRLQGGHPVLTAGAFLPPSQSCTLTPGELFQAEAEGDLPGFWFGYFDPEANYILEPGRNN